jgi:uncharacterized membrane protein
MAKEKASANVEKIPSTEKKAASVTNNKKTTIILTNNEKIAAVLSYVHFLALVPFFTDKAKNEFTRFHIKQGLVLFFTEVVCFFFVSYTKVFFWQIGFWIGMSANIIYLLVSAFSVYKALKGEKWKIPLISKLADRIELK